MSYRILVVCIGNICRSPMAEALLRRDLQVSGSGAEVSSAGLGALVGHPADDIAQRLMERRDLDISGHRARQLDQQLIQQADLVLVMEQSHRRSVETQYPTARGKVFRLGEWSGLDVPDPYRQPEAAFEYALELIDKGVNDWVAKLKELIAK